MNLSGVAGNATTMVLASPTMVAVLSRLARRALLPLAFAGLALSTTGCLALVAGENDTTVNLNVAHGDGQQFFNWNEITLSQSINDVNSATMIGVDMHVVTPVGADLTFLSPPIIGEAVNGSRRTQVVSLSEIKPGETTAAMKVDYYDDLKDLFRDEHTIRIEWSGRLNPAFTNWPADGIDCKATVKIDIE